MYKLFSKELTKEFGRGFSRSNLQNMRNFYLAYPKCQTLSGKLTWSHYCELLSIEDEHKQSFYEKESENSNWSVRELKRQMKTSLYERLILSQGDEHKKKVLELATGGNEINNPEDIVKDPYVLIELKTGKLMPEAVGQLNMYLNYYRTEVNDEHDNEPIGIILCTDKESIEAEYALGGLSNKIFASKYTLYIPNKEELEKQVEKVLGEFHML